MARLPTTFIPHGGGPWPLLPVASDPGYVALTRHLGALAKATAAAKALLIVSAHWEEDVPTVTTADRGGLVFDYYNFPAHTYDVAWRPPGDPQLAARVRALLTGAGIASADAPDRGLDHGVFVPGMVGWPKADVPVVQLSMVKGLDPATHLAIGRALAPLRDEGVFLLGSGMSYHNLRALFRGSPTMAQDATRFDAWMREAVGRPRPARDAALTAWAEAPSARAAHPREEHLMPLHVVAGAAGDDPVSTPYRNLLHGASVSSVHFGTPVPTVATVAG